MGLSKTRNPQGELAYYRLTEWWLTCFTEEERQYIDTRYQPMGSGPQRPTQGNVLSSSQPVTNFLNGLSTWFRSSTDRSIADRIHQKIDELARTNPVSGPGYYRGRHFTTYVYDVEKLKRETSFDEAEILLLELVKSTEAESRIDNNTVAPWYYEELAKIYRKRKDFGREVAILERYLEHTCNSGPKPRLLERLNKARHLAATAANRRP